MTEYVTLYFQMWFPIEKAVAKMKRIVGEDAIITIGGIVVNDRAGYFVMGHKNAD
jgi:hypothetical protein